MTDVERPNLRLLPVADEEDDLIRAKPKPAEVDACRHDRTELDRDAHRLFCRDCEQEVDPFDFLLRMVQERDRWRRDGESARAKYRLAARELEAVERQIKNAKARLRKQGALLTAAEAQAARTQFRALARSLPNIFREVARDDEGALEEAKRVAKLCGYRQEDAEKALGALDREVEALTVRRQH